MKVAFLRSDTSTAAFHCYSKMDVVVVHSVMHLRLAHRSWPCYHAHNKTFRGNLNFKHTVTDMGWWDALWDVHVNEHLLEAAHNRLYNTQHKPRSNPSWRFQCMSVCQKRHAQEHTTLLGEECIG